MPLSQNDLKFLKRRKHNQISLQNSNRKLQFDLENKKIFTAEEDHFCHPVSEQNFLSNSKKHSNHTELSIEDCLSFENLELETQRKNEGSWNYFSFSDINQIEYDQKKKFRKYSNELTVEDFSKLEALTQNWKGCQTDMAYQSVCSIQYY